MSPLTLSLFVASLSTVLVAVLGIPLALWLSRTESRWSRVFDALVTAPLVIPPVVVGYYLLIAFGPEGVLGQLLARVFGHSVVFHWTGAVLAGAVVAFPLLVRSARTAFESIPRGLVEAAAVHGASPIRTLRLVLLPLAAPGIGAGLALSFARALGEFGATIVVAGNIPELTQTLPMAIYDAIFSGDYAAANRMVGTITVLAFFLLIVAEVLHRKSRRTT